jgi:hypothetical protein
MLPIAVYEAVWIKTFPVIVHMTLVEHIVRKTRKAYWLRVGVIYDVSKSPRADTGLREDEASPIEEGSEKDGDGELQVLTVLSNDVGRLIMDQPANWVDLHAVSCTMSVTTLA